MNKSWLLVAGCWLLVVMPGVVFAATSEPSYCCERTTSGAWCVNDEESACASGYNLAPTSCETTSFCRLGTCYDSSEGICMGNTPQRVCNDNGGTWDEREVEEVPQCSLGCCVISDQAAFVSLVRCKKLASFFGVENNWRDDIADEVSCIATAQGQDTGACVYEKEFERICEFTTREECGANDVVEVVNGSDVDNSGKTFYKDFLCSAEELNTVCARQASTTCYQGDVYFVDSCGNRENVYSTNEAKSWNNGKVLEADEVCSPTDGNNLNCGNCDYLLGSRCAAEESIFGGNVDHYCQKTECVDREGNSRINGESWCVDDFGSRESDVGSRHYREICVDGDVKVEACSDFRNEICIEGGVDTSAGFFGTAACRVNRWQDCTAQSEKDDCENKDKRDCRWVGSITGMIFGSGSSGGSTSFSNPTANSGKAFTNPTASGSITGNSIFGGGDDDESKEEGSYNAPDGFCVPEFPPGLKFWEEGSASAICSQASARCVVKYEKGLLDSGWDCVEGCECLEEGWGASANGICSALGDCGGSVNYVGKYSDDGYAWKVDGTKKKV